VIVFHSLQNHFHPQDKNSINGNNKYRDSNLKKKPILFPRFSPPAYHHSRRQENQTEENPILNLKSRQNPQKKINQAIKQAVTHSVNQSIE
jgi:hypothetical protein